MKTTKKITIGGGFHNASEITMLDQPEIVMSSIKKRELLSHGFIAFTGQKWADCQVDNYNAIQCSINQFIQHNMQIPDYLLKGSHNLFLSYSYA